MITKNDIRDSHFQVCSALRDAVKLLEFTEQSIPSSDREDIRFATRLAIIKRTLSKAQVL